MNPGPAKRAHAAVRGGQIVLNFENAELREVVRVILGDTLKVSYLYDPRIQGIVTLRTAGSMRIADVLSALEMVLRSNGAALIIDDGLYRVVPADEAVRSGLIPELGESGTPIPPGYSVRIVPLSFISAIQMEKLLQPFVRPEGVVRVDIDRNLLVLAGTSFEVKKLVETVQIFDVDWLEGMSVAIFPLIHVSAEKIAEELDVVFGDAAEGPLAGMVRLVPIKRLNALMVATSRSSFLDKAEEWIKRLDRGSTTGQNLYVYSMQNGKASDLAKILTEVFVGRQARQEKPARLAPGRTKKELKSKEGAEKDKGKLVKTTKPKNSATPPKASGTETGRVKGQGLAFAKDADIRIIADEINNALLILASAEDYRMVEAAIIKLDIIPLQVLVEVTIAEVTLNETLRYGVQWFFQSTFGNNRTATGVLSTVAGGAIASPLSGLSLVLNSGNVQAALDMLESVTKVNIISSPHLMIRDNQSAELQVGDEVPVVTQQQQSTSGEANLVNTVQYRDTGVILRVSPRVSASGAINMEIEQEVSTVQANADSPLTPTISQRIIKTAVAVQSGQTIVLGGLIQDQKTDGVSGVPLLSQIPIIGSLFGTTTKSLVRTELIVLISPRVVRDHAEAQMVTKEIREKVLGIRGLRRFRAPGTRDAGDRGKNGKDTK